MNRKLGVFETAQVRTNSNFAFNLVLTLRLRNGPSPAAFAAAVRSLQARHPLLQTRIEPRGSGFAFFRDGSLDIPITHLSRIRHSDWRDLVQRELSTPFDLESSPPARTYYLYDPRQEESEAVLTFQHCVADAVSAGALAEEFLRLCGLADAQAETPSIAETPHPPAEALFPPSFRGLRRYGKTALFLLRQIGEEVAHRRGRRGLPETPIPARGRCRILSMILDRETSTALSSRCRREKVTLNSLFSAALLTAVQLHRYGDEGGSYRHFYTADLRPYLDPPVQPSVLGSYFSMMRMTLKLTPSPDTWQIARKIQEVSLRSLKRGDKFSAFLLTDAMMKRTFRLKSERMGTTGLSYTPPLSPPAPREGGELTGIHALVSNFVLGPEYTAFVRLFKERFFWDILYLDSDMDREEAEVIAETIRRLLCRAAGGQP